MAAGAGFSDALPYELNLEIWLALPYGSVKILCQETKKSTRSEAQLPKEICQDPQSWVTRAVRKFEINPKTFWDRSVVEQALPLGGNKAQGRYVEIVSRDCVVSDSSYFLSDSEMTRRAALENDYPLFKKHVSRAALIGSSYHENQQFPNEIVTHNAMYGGISEQIINELTARFRAHILYSEAYLSGFRNQSFESGLISDKLDHIAGLIRGHHLEEARSALKSVVGLHVDSTTFHYVTLIVDAIYRIGDLDLFDLVTETFELDHILFIDSPVVEVMAVTDNPHIFTLVKDYYQTADEHQRARAFSLLGFMLEMAAKYNRFDNIRIFQTMMGEDNIFASNETMTYVSEKSLAERYGLQFVEWLLENGWTRQRIQDYFFVNQGITPSGEFGSKAVRAWISG